MTPRFTILRGPASRSATVVKAVAASSCLSIRRVTPYKSKGLTPVSGGIAIVVGFASNPHSASDPGLRFFMKDSSDEPNSEGGIQSLTSRLARSVRACWRPPLGLWALPTNRSCSNRFQDAYVNSF